MNYPECRFLLCALVVAILSALAFVPGLPGGFVLDDGVNILHNHILYVERFDIEQLIYAALNFHEGNGARALPMLSFALDHLRAGGMDAAAFKTTNIVIHGLTAFFMALFLRRLLLVAKWSTDQHAALAGLLLALAWAVHPLQVSSVLYVVQRMQTMATLFIVLALWAYLAMRQAQIDGQRGRLQGVFVVLAWLLALACKEDAVLLPAYTLALELTVLRFAAAQPKVARGLRQCYALMTLAGLALFVFYALPRYWSWDAYGRRDFSSPERLLTQARVLVMYLWQIVLPWPDNMPFNYDGYPVSRSLWHPWTTLPSLLFLVVLLTWAWRWRFQRPLFAFGLLLFFAGHFISSNIIALELVFEHRNHLPLLGVVLAVGDLLQLAVNRMQRAPRIWAAGFAVLLLLSGSATLVRAHTWGDPLRLGEKLAALAPHSSRSWVEWSGAWFNLYKKTEDINYLQKAIEVGEQSFRHLDSVTVAGNIILFKSMLGTLAEADWQRFYTSLRNSPPGVHRRHVVLMLLKNAEKEFISDKAGVVQAMNVLLEVELPGVADILEMGVFAYKAEMPEQAMVFFRLAAQRASADEVLLKQLIRQLDEAGRSEWAEELRNLHLQRSG